MNDRDKVIKGLEQFIADFKPFCGNKFDWQRVDDALALLKDSGQVEGWLCEKRTSGRQITDLLCACGNKVYFTTLLFNDGFTANELYCPNCGLSMRSPHRDKEGVWLRKHWEEVVLKAQEPRVMTLEEVKQERICWIEDADDGMTVRLFPATMFGVGEYANGSKSYMFLAQKPWAIDAYDCEWWYLIEDYGKTWRCWTSRPTDEQRGATPWK